MKHSLQSMDLGGMTHKIGGYVHADWTNQDITRTVQFIFGASTIGINLPAA